MTTEQADQMIRMLDRIDRRLSNVESKLQAQPLKMWQTIARDPARKIEAIRILREETGCDLSEAKDEVEAFIRTLRYDNAA
jgi:ribosomal protein L7/L12